MEDIVESFAKRLGIEYKAARQGIAITCRHFLQVSEPIKATGLLSMLPSKLTVCLLMMRKTKSQQTKRIFLRRKLLRKYQMNTLMVISKKQKRYMKKQ